MSVSLTRKQVQSGPGAELLHLLSEGAGAGWVSDDQIRNLSQWLRANLDSAIPAVPFLAKLTDELLRDGKIGSDGRHTLRVAVERVLPPDQRDLVKLKRQTIEADERAKAKEAKVAEKQRAREYARLSRPRSFNFMVAGTAHEGRPETIRERVTEGHRVFLVREPENAHDRNAISIWTGYDEGTVLPDQTSLTLQPYDIGFVPREVAMDMASLLDAGYKQLAFCTKILGNAARGPIPVIDVSLYHPQGNAPREALVVSSRNTTELGDIAQTRVQPRRMEPLMPGWMVLLLILILVLVFFLALAR